MTLLLTGALLSGLVAGVIAGLLGVGGGLVLVPALLYLFHLDGIHIAIAMPLAVGTSLATIVVTNSMATWHHHQRQSVRWEMVRQYAPAILLGSWLGSHLAVMMDAITLRSVFGLFECAIGLRMIYPGGSSESSSPPIPMWMHSFLALFIGCLSSLFGIGGGTLSVPALTMLANIPIHQAVGSSSAIGIFISVAGVLGFVHAGWDNPTLPATSVGFVFSPAFLGIIAGTILTTPLGVRLAHTLDPKVLRKGFGFLLLAVGSKLAFF
ncbi:MAG: sulfite exporter TauE/SafE family protein [Magnetococcales bacterium]|nr:sulfite exporter TauE/SafE family protein [Magnetococcales bacterium]NGZ26140.1 sulfite exporter TauE/SafE family protein [Magnetococcales bacterium]